MSAPKEPHYKIGIDGDFCLNCHTDIACRKKLLFRVTGKGRVRSTETAFCDNFVVQPYHRLKIGDDGAIHIIPMLPEDHVEEDQHQEQSYNRKREEE